LIHFYKRDIELKIILKMAEAEHNNAGASGVSATASSASRSGGVSVTHGRSSRRTHMPPRDALRSKSESLVFPQDRDFDPDPDPSQSWISGTYSETSPLFPGGDVMGERDASPPKDKYRFVWLVFYMLGMTTLLPWNFFIAVSGYWNFKFRDPDSNSTSTDTTLQKEFTSYLAIASNIPNATFVVLNVFYGRSFNLNIRIIGALSLISTLFIGVILMARINSDHWQMWFLYSTLIIVVLLNICTAVFQGGIIGVAGKFPLSYMGGMMSGQALGGIFPALVNILVISQKVNGADVGFYCFIVAFVFVILSLALYCAVQTTDFFKHYAGNRQDDASDHGETSYKEVFQQSWKYQLSVFINFATSLSVFPSVTVLVDSQYRDDETNTFARVYFTPVTCFLLFNCGDYLGRIVASHLKLPNSSTLGQNATLLISLIRIGFIPLLMFCNAAPGIRRLPVYFDNDAYYYVIMIIFSISNGYVGNLCMMNGPKTVERKDDQECAASMLVSVLVLGIGLGSALSYPIVNVL